MGSSEASYEHRFLREYEPPPPVGFFGGAKTLVGEGGGARHASSGGKGWGGVGWGGWGRGRICFQRREEESLLWRYCREIS